MSGPPRRVKTRLGSKPPPIATQDTRSKPANGVELRSKLRTGSKPVATPLVSKKRPLTIPMSPNWSKPRATTVRKPYQKPTMSTLPMPTRSKKRALTVPISPKFSKPRISKIQVQRNKVPTKRIPLPKKLTLTKPLSPNFSKRPSRRTTDKMSATTKELLEIKAKRQEVLLERRKNQHYHQVTQGFRQTGNAPPKSKFSMILRSAGVIGVPAIRRPKLTTFKEFNFLTDQRAIEKINRNNIRKAVEPPTGPYPKRRRTT